MLGHQCEHWCTTTSEHEHCQRKIKVEYDHPLADLTMRGGEEPVIAVELLEDRFSVADALQLGWTLIRLAELAGESRLVA